MKGWNGMRMQNGMDGRMFDNGSIKYKLVLGEQAYFHLISQGCIKHTGGRGEQ